MEAISSFLHRHLQRQTKRCWWWGTTICVCLCIFINTCILSDIWCVRNWSRRLNYTQIPKRKMQQELIQIDALGKKIKCWFCPIFDLDTPIEFSLLTCTHYKLGDTILTLVDYQEYYSLNLDPDISTLCKCQMSKMIYNSDTTVWWCSFTLKSLRQSTD